MRVDAVGCAALVALAIAFASTGASAWQRPRTEPSAKLEACPEMGDGFVRVAGSRTCIRLSGSVRVEAMHVGGATGSGATGR